MLTAAWGGLLVVGSVVPTPAGLETGVSDTFLHGALYGVLALLVFWSYLPVWGPNGAGLAGFLGTVTLGGFTEALQSLVPWRSAEAGDLVADAVGAGVAVALALLAVRFRRQEAR